MGSSSVSSSTTGYDNKPVTQEDVSNPFNQFLTAAGSSNRFNSDNIQSSSYLSQGSGGTININDPNLLGKAFDFGSSVVGVFADLTKARNAANNEAAKEEVKEAATGETKTVAEFDWTKYKTELMLGGGLLLIWYFGGFKK